MSAVVTVPVRPTDFAWFSEVAGAPLVRVPLSSALSLIRYARRTYVCDMVPVVTEYVILSETNAYGDDVCATVQYARSGAVSSVGGSLAEDGHIVWTCYAD